MEEFEHLGNVGLGVWHYGLYRSDSLLSVLSFGPTCFSGKRDRPTQLAQAHGCHSIQLCRGGTAVHAPRNTASVAVSSALRAIQRDIGPALVTAYADPLYGEVGTIYQASNAYFLGWTDPKGQANYIIHGQRVSGWVVRKRYGTRALPRLRQIDPDVVAEKLRPKMRYALVAAHGRQRRMLQVSLADLAQPYPKRDEFGIRSMIELGNIVPRHAHDSLNASITQVATECG